MTTREIADKLQDGPFIVEVRRDRVAEHSSASPWRAKVIGLEWQVNEDGGDPWSPRVVLFELCHFDAHSALPEEVDAV